MSDNRMTGTIPPEMGLLSKLERLDASRNRFSGSIPTEMQQMNRNVQLNLTGNLYVNFACLGFRFSYHSHHVAA